MCRQEQAKSPHQVWGWQQEQVAAAEARARGFQVAVPDEWQVSFDLTLFDDEGKVIQMEVKSARPKVRKLGNGHNGVRLQFKHNGAENEAQVYWLRAYWQGEVTHFFVPAEVMAEKSRTISITSNPATYKGWLAEYRGRWDIVYERMV